MLTKKALKKILERVADAPKVRVIRSAFYSDDEEEAAYMDWWMRQGRTFKYKTQTQVLDEVQAAIKEAQDLNATANQKPAP